MKYTIIGAIYLCLFGCAFFSRNPALPRPAAGEAANDGTTNRMQAVLNADVIYFPVEMIATDDSTKIVQTLKSSGTSFALAWQGIELENSDQTTRREPHWSYTGQLRDQCKALMLEAIDAPQLYLGLPPPIRTKLQTGALLRGEEKNIVPRGYRIPSGSLEDFAEQLATMHGLGEQDVENLYRAHVVAAQFAAEKIVLFMREHAGEKLLVLAQRRELSGACGIPAFVSQKLKVRQITFDRERAPAPQPRLVRGSGSRGSWRRL
jgi:hypothetical protein